MANATVTANRFLADRYELLAPLGAGTAATVYRVRDRRTGALRAAKVLTPENAAKSNVRARFEDEFRVLRTLHHPHLPEVYDYGWTLDGGRFMVMELVDGVPLDEYFRANPRDIWAILYELCETLTFVHNHKLLHQDVKPSNILVKRTTAFGPDLPLVKLIDFGLIYKRDVGAAVELVGTPEYIAPEVARGDRSLTRAVDYYSLGATLYHLLVGRPPFLGSISEVLHAHLELTPVIEEEELEWAELYPHVRALLTKDWRARLEAFEEFRRAVVSRLTGGIEELDQAYKLARTESPMREKLPAETEIWLSEVAAASVASDSKRESAIQIVGRVGATRSRLVDALSAEAAIRGCYVLRLGPGSRAAPDESSNRVQGHVDRFNRTIQRIEATRPTAVCVVVNGIELLSDEEAALVRYLVTMQALKPTGGNKYLFLIARDVGGADHPLDSYLPADRVPIVLPPDREARAKSGGSDGVYYVGAIAKAALDNALSDSQRKILSYIASHPAPVPREWVRAFAYLSESEFSEEVDRLITRHLVYPVTVEAADALAASDVARSLGLSIASPKDLRAIHRDLAARLEKPGASVERGLSAVLELVAYHRDATGEHREGLVARIRAIKAAWRAGSLSDVERIAQSNLTTVAKSSALSKAARHYFVKQWVLALWARNQHKRAKQVIDDHIVKQGDVIPPSLLPKYIRGVLDAEGPALALEFVAAIDGTRLSVRAEQQVLLEKVLLLYHCARYEDSLSVLERLGKGEALGVKDRHRMVNYRAMNLADLGRYEEVENLMERDSARALADGCNDEFVLMSAIRAQERTLQGHPRDALEIIARTMRIAHGDGLYLRLNALYRLAATAYRDLGLTHKALYSQSKAIELASALGLSLYEAMSWVRLAEYERVLGRFGNALRYLAKAKSIMGSSSHESDRAGLNLLTLYIHGWLRSPDLQDAIENAEWISGVRGPNERGRYFMMIGNSWMDRGDWMESRHFYDQAAVLLERAGLVDNLIMLRRSRLRLELHARQKGLGAKEYKELIAPRLRTADSASGQLERNIALLEFSYVNRSDWKDIGRLCEACLQLADGSAEARLKLEALALVFRCFARHDKRERAEATFSKFWALLKTAAGSLDERYVAGLLERLDVAQLAREWDLLTKRNKAGVTTSLAAERGAAAS